MRGAVRKLLKERGSRSRADVAKTAPPFSVRICHMTRAMVCASKQLGVSVMSVHVKKFRAALKHGAFSATAILPGEDPAALKELHQKLIAELTPVGALEDHIVWTIARLVWRKKHLATLRIGELALEHQSRIQAQKSQFELLEMEKYSAERREATMQAAEDQARKDLGAHYELVEVGETATVECPHHRRYHPRWRRCAFRARKKNYVSISSSV